MGIRVADLGVTRFTCIPLWPMLYVLCNRDYRAVSLTGSTAILAKVEVFPAHAQEV